MSRERPLQLELQFYSAFRLRDRTTQSNWLYIFHFRLPRMHHLEIDRLSPSQHFQVSVTFGVAVGVLPRRRVSQCRATVEPRGDRASLLSSLSLSQSGNFQQLRGRSLYRQKAIEIAGNRNVSPYNTTNCKYFCHHRLQLGQYR
ncbi:hypothetical protein [Baaleninema simplex]|uniref:hypothetical protein n=1 Tax=Baaleninema simplex TaxID=2862350 RepID=UPI0011818469|nr:hypothetical protein [Baaleninema simplex]